MATLRENEANAYNQGYAQARQQNNANGFLGVILGLIVLGFLGFGAYALFFTQTATTDGPDVINLPAPEVPKAPDVNVNVPAPNVNVDIPEPKISKPEIEVPDVNVNVPSPDQSSGDTSASDGTE